MTTDVHPDEVLKAILDKGNRRDKEEKLRNYQVCYIIIDSAAQDNYPVLQKSAVDIVRTLSPACLFYYHGYQL